MTFFNKFTLIFFTALSVITIIVGLANDIFLAVVGMVSLVGVISLYFKSKEFLAVDKEKLYKLHVTLEELEQQKEDLIAKKTALEVLVANDEEKLNKLMSENDKISTTLKDKEEEKNILIEKTADLQQSVTQSENLAAKLTTLQVDIENQQLIYQNLQSDIDRIKNEHQTVLERFERSRKKIEYVDNLLTEFELEKVKNMDGIAFENYAAKLLEFSGFENIQVSQASNDQGIDVFAEKDGLKYGIQCKCYSSPVGNKAVQEVIAGALFFKLDKKIVLTNNFFTSSAKDLARKTNVVLWDQLLLKDMIYTAISIDPEFSNYEVSYKEKTSSNPIIELNG